MSCLKQTERFVTVHHHQWLSLILYLLYLILKLKNGAEECVVEYRSVLFVIPHHL
jgi:hypothetical protein